MGTHDEQPLWRQAATHTLHTSLLLKAILEERLQEASGLVLADNEALLNLAHADGGLRMSDIADRLILSRGGTTKVIDRLEVLGYVERVADPQDRRATMVEITDAGRAAMAVARVVIDEGLKAAWAQHISDDEARVIVEVMRRVLEEHPGEH
jgi:DNA-binding MarR family transcriptional regulator